jgi:RHS repeat-associated protein
MTTSAVCAIQHAQHESRYTGKERDTESGLDYFGARYYSSNTGRFMSPDPLGPWVADATNPQTWNMYSYALNNPLTNIDPSGLDCVYFNDAGNGVESVDRSSSSGECGQNGGDWINGRVQSATYFSDSDTFGFRSSDASNNYTTYANAPGSQQNGTPCYGNCDISNGYFQSSNMQTNDVPLNPYAQGVFNQVGLQTGPTLQLGTKVFCNALTLGNAGSITGALAGAPIPKALITSVPSAGGAGVSSVTSLSSAASSSVFSGGDPVLTGAAGQFLKSISATGKSFAGTARIGGAIGRVGGKIAGSEAAAVVAAVSVACY